MNEGMSSGKVQTLSGLSSQLRIGFDSLEQILEKLAQANLVRRLVGSGWVMIRDAEHVELAQLYRLFVFDPAKLEVHHDDAAIRAWLQRQGNGVVTEAVLTLQDVLMA
jgi:membrane protein